MKIAIDCGHTLVGADYGASGIKEESLLTREVGTKVINLLKAAGHTVIDCTVDSAVSLSSSLVYRTQKANNAGADYYVSIHFNCFNGSAKGTEVLYYSSTDARMSNVLAKICNLGFTNRGLKQRTGLAVLKNTNMRAMLIECCFCDNQEDMNRYNADAMAKAIVEGFLGVKINTPLKNTSTPKPSNSDWLTEYLKTWNWTSWVKQLQAECNSQGFSNQEIDGIAGSNTLKGCPTLKQGAKGNITRLLQRVLKAYGIANLIEDGDFGAATCNAVIKYQQSKGLGADGIVGKNTWKALLGV